MTDSNKWSIHQNGFMKDHRTEDNLFVLKTLFNNEIKSKKKVHVCFVDFSKFFDTINRDHLYYKLIANGIGGNVLHIIKSMYDSGHYTIKLENELYGRIHSRTGVKQGCCMSPILSNIFQNDLHDIFDKECTPLELNKIPINSISWADDLVLMSQTENGLQRCLDKLYDYCYKWGLSVNTVKIKCMIINDKKGVINSNTYYNNMELEMVDNYTYLGLKIHKSNKHKYMIEDRMEKAKRMLYPIKQLVLAGNNINLPVALSVFDKQVAPVLLYGTPVWTLPENNKFLYVNGVPETNENTKSLVEGFIENVVGKRMIIKSAKRIGKAQTNEPRKILAEMSDVKDRDVLLYNQNTTMFTKYERKEKNKIESVANNLYKFLLGQSKFASTTACMGELGRYLLYIRAWTLSMKYWLRLEKGTNNILLNHAYHEEKLRKNWWIENIETILKENGFAYVINKSKETNTDAFCRQFQQRLIDQSIQQWHTRITESNKLKHATKLEHNYRRSPYLDNLDSRKLKATVCSLRIGYNNLGYSYKNKTKTCPKCGHDIETVEHVILYCKEYEEGRKRLMEKLKKEELDIKFMALNDQNKITSILDLSKNCLLWKALNEICTFIKYIDCKRQI